MGHFCKTLTNTLSRTPPNFDKCQSFFLSLPLHTGSFIFNLYITGNLPASLYFYNWQAGLEKLPLTFCLPAGSFILNGSASQAICLPACNFRINRHGGKKSKLPGQPGLDKNYLSIYNCLSWEKKNEFYI